jgi:hypothetical protein
MKIKTENEKKNINYISVKSSDFGIAQNNSVEFYFDHYSKRIVLDASSVKTIEIGYNPAREKKRKANLEFNNGIISCSTSNK